MTDILRIGEAKALLLGNEAIARGALEAGIRVATGYPGTPSTEIVEALADAAKELDIYVEWSVNEKVALEVAVGASMSGLRALTAMKHVGLNVASDPFMSLGYTGVEGGLVIVSADDPNCHSSQNEQDNRLYGIHAYIPVYEPSSPQEAKDLTKYLYWVSEQNKTAILLRVTTRLSHTRGDVSLGPLRLSSSLGEFRREPSKWVLLPVNARRLKKEALKRLERIRELNERMEFNKLIEGDERKLGVIACGIAYPYVMEALNLLGVKELTVLKLSSIYPLPRRLLNDLFSRVEEVLVIEEGDPLVENEVRALAPKGLKVYGKDVLPTTGELSLNSIVEALNKILGLGKRSMMGVKKLNIELPPRPPTLCPGCPHRATFYAVKIASARYAREGVFPGDIGCYTLGFFPPFSLVDTCLCMGSSIGIANGLAHSTKQPIIAIIGDSTFFHTGIQPLINAVYNGAGIVVIVMDNAITAMTGHQPHPGSGLTARGEKTIKIKIEDLAKAIGVSYVKVVDPYDLKETIAAISEAIAYTRERGSPALIVARRECALQALRRLRREAGKEPPKYVILRDRCKKCMLCLNSFACPAIRVDKEGTPYIDEDLCSGCGVCAQVCPFNAIVKVVGNGREDSN